ncbi:hypothetical protein NC651_033056 [Populus alba x Populus x berolinensis]|nr:hypothetical protein NC651_033056 [Populus alba x Populus x berolinensis]
MHQSEDDSPHLGGTKKKEAENREVSDQKGTAMYLFRSFRPARIQSSTPSNTINK